MSESCPVILDPRVRRTRHLLHQALAHLLETKEFEKISVQDIAEAATVNRATFYDHYPDKFALLQCMVGERFQELLTARQVRFDGACESALKTIVRSLCDYLVTTSAGQLQPHTESAVINVVRTLILEGLRQHPRANGVSPELLATTISWAMYGAAKEWLQTPNRCPPDQISTTIAHLLEWGRRGRSAMEP
jgi:AcrR family transcriptional regulator